MWFTISISGLDCHLSDKMLPTTYSLEGFIDSLEGFIVIYFSDDLNLFLEPSVHFDGDSWKKRGSMIVYIYIYTIIYT